MAHFAVQNLSFSYPGGPEALHNVNLCVEPGEYIVLCGKSGSGKTTLLRHFKTVLTPFGPRVGEILFHSVPLPQVSQREQAAKIGFVMQSPDDQIVTDQVWHELAFGLESLGCDQQTMRARVAEMASYFGIQDWFHRNIAELSGGQKQLLNLAAVMAMQPEALILDEPTSQLDPIAASDFLNTVRKLNAELGITVILSEHRLEDILPYADRILVMDRGRVIADGAPRSVGKRLFESQSDMLAAMPTPLRVYYGTGGTGDAPLTVREGRTWLSAEFPQPPKNAVLPAPPQEKNTAPSALELKELWFRYEKNGPDILRGTNLTVQTGFVHAIVGGNGAGKSTVLKVVCDLCRPYRGKALVFGKNAESYRSGSLFRNCLAMLPQKPRSLFVRKTVREELCEMTEDAQRVAEITELCQIGSLLDRHPCDLSGGEQQRTALAKVLLTNPRLLLLDEPTKGMDNFFKERFTAILTQLRARGVTVLLVSHDVEFCARCADRVSMLFDGQILSTDTPRRFFGGNSFYTTAANRMSRHIFSTAVTPEDVIALYRMNREAQP